MQIRMLPEVEDCCVFPHMGDGGLALGAAFQSNYELNGITSYRCHGCITGGCPTPMLKI